MATMNTIQKVLQDAIYRQIPVILEGMPGVGKTSMIKYLAERMNRKLFTVIASTREPQDFGYPIISKNKLTFNGQEFSVIETVPPDFAVQAEINEGIIFFDEITCTPPATQAPLLRGIQEYVFGEFKLSPDKVAIIAACNPPEISPGGFSLAAPFANRCAHIDFQLDINHWIENFPSYWGNPPLISRWGKTLNEKQWSSKRAVMASFIKSFPNLLLDFPKSEQQQAKAWASPRTIEMASRELVNPSDEETMVMLMTGLIGHGTTLQYLQYEKDLDMPDIEHLIAHPKTFRMPKRGDKAFAILSAVSAAIVNDLTVERWQAGWEIMATACKTKSKDIAAMAARTLARANNTGLPTPSSELAEFLPLLEGMNL